MSDTHDLVFFPFIMNQQFSNYSVNHNVGGQMITRCGNVEWLVTNCRDCADCANCAV